MPSRADTAERLGDALRLVLGTPELPVRVRAWDGSVTGPPDAPVVVIRSRRAIRRMLWAPGELGLARAYVAGELDVDGDLYAAFAALSAAGRLNPDVDATPPTVGERLALLRIARELRVIGPPPAPPPEELHLGRRGRRHSRARDAVAVSSHYDVGNDFYGLVLGPSMVYSCAVWADEATGLDAAQEAKLDLVCRKLALAPGMRLLDVGCGWGSLALHAATRYDVDVVGVTLSGEQARLARERVAAEGLSDRIDIRVQDYRDVVDGPFDAIASVGMAEHVGADELPGYCRALHDLLRPGGRVLHHAIAWSGGPVTWDDAGFIARYVFPDGELVSLGRMVGLLEDAGLEALDVEALRRHYALTLRAWVDRLEKNWDAAVALTSPGRARVWRLYMAASALSFEAGVMGVNQVLVQRPGGENPPLRLRDWR